MRIVIIGAGVAGCILTRTLSRLPGVEVICLERVRAGEHASAQGSTSVPTASRRCAPTTQRWLTPSPQ
jgi:choline dehydrogenase-like flavoprotein